MISNNIISSTDVIQLEDLRKVIKASVGVWYIFEEERIVIYGMHDVMFTTISRIIVPNTTSIRSGTLCFYNKESEFSEFCKTLIPLTDIQIDRGVLINMMNGTLLGSCRIFSDLEFQFIEKRNKLNENIDHYTARFSVGQETKDNLKFQLSAMRATMSQRFFSIADRFLITIYAGLLPLNKADTFNIDVIYDEQTFLCKYEIFKKKAPAPIYLFIKYRRL